VNPTALEEARKAAERILRTGQEFDQKDLVEGGNGLLDALDRIEERSRKGEGEPGEGEPGEGPPSEGVPSEGEGEGEGEAEGEGAGDKEEKNRAKREAKERGQAQKDLDDKVERLYRIIVRRERQAEKNIEGPTVPAWVLGLGGGRGEGTETEVKLDARPQFLLEAQGQLTAAINESRRLLARIMVPVTQRESFVKAGRFMARKLSQFYTESMSKAVERMYEIDKTRFKNEAPAVAFVVDVSGSFAAMEPQLHMVHLVEAFRRFQPANRFALYIFGTYWARVKGFNEPWSAVDRIGDYEKAGGSTTLSGALKAALRDVSAVPYRTKLVVILSDFYVEHETADVVLGARWGGVRVLPVQAQGNDEAMIQNLPPRQVFFRIEEYSEVVKVMLDYLAATFGGYPPPGAYYTPDTPSGTVYQVPPRS
jgi:VWA domain containing CoxE-like protein